MAFAEVEAYALVNVARTATPLATSSVEDTNIKWGLQYVNDGQHNSILYSSLGWISSNSLQNNHTETLTLNLGTAKTFTYVDLYPRNDTGVVGTDFPVDFTIDASSDGTTWAPLVTRLATPLPVMAVCNALASLPRQYSICVYKRRNCVEMGTEVRPIVWPSPKSKLTRRPLALNR
ncbi:discoidin domain-containing protein [Tengunoibacter tsumagoiensis]|uniref:F5/8 type C domain-containing protein n=1 Tax=Tengunoibacter tsumagoiensis TaxID=2014871 RepID=A0A402A7T9_9CHLR|nr:discoidin domain-containing protein [Tengunoibacter tsumagoiensis]GCE15139.1 hypothetical protein KTT_49980 [Tengunoibacter tsumagoiensis]